MEIKELLFTLSNTDNVGSLNETSNKVYEILSNYTQTEICDGNIIGFLKGKKDYTLMLDAHIDQVAFVVTNIDDNGFLTVSNVGGIDIRSLPSRTVTVHGKEKISAVFSAIPPHLSNGENEYDDISKIKLDTALGNKAKEIVSVGDFVTFKGECLTLSNEKVCGRSFDDRAGVTCLLQVAKRLSKKELPINIAFAFTHSEELGLRGVRTAAYKINPQEAIAIDVTFGDGIGLTEEESSPLGKGSAIGVSPSLSRQISNALIKTSKNNNIPYTVEVMSERTGTNADMLAVSREGVKTSTLSIPLRNMHTETEILDLRDITAACDLLEKYILNGGVSDD